MTPSEPGWRPAVDGFTRAWQRVMTDPHGFFAEMPQAGGLGEPGTFLVIVAALNAIGRLILGWGIGGAISWFLLVVVAAVVIAALFTLIAQNLFDGRAGFEPTFRVVAYSCAPLVFAWVPLVGSVARLYAAYLAMRGVERVHAVDTTRAVLTVVLGMLAMWAVSFPAGLWL